MKISDVIISVGIASCIFYGGFFVIGTIYWAIN